MTDDNIEALKARVAELEARLARMEMRMDGERPAVQPPPILFDTTPQAAPKATPQPEPTKFHDRLTRPVAQPAPAAPAPTASETEYQLGGKVLPWLGAVITILSIGFGVSIAYKQGFITPAMIFGGGVILSLLFIAFGQWKRDEREEFGEILTGVGVCGLYITFTAGHVVQKLFEGETLVVLFTLLSLANLAYGFWRSSRAFLVLGVLGGFAAALMPLNESKVALSLGLHFLILVPCAAIVFHRRWLVDARILWVVALLVLLPRFGSWFDWRWQVAAIYGTTLLCFLAYARAWVSGSWDKHGAFGPTMMAASAGLAFLLHQGTAGSVHVLLFGLALAGLSALPWDRGVRATTAVAALGIPLVLAPCGLAPYPAALVFAGLSAALAAVSWVRLPKVLSLLAGVEFLLASAAYLSAYERGLSWESETLVLGAILVAGVVSAVVLIRAWESVEELFLVAALALMPLAGRLMVIVLGVPAIGADLFTAEVWVLAASSSVLAVFGIRNGWYSAIALSIATMLLTLIVYFGRMDQQVQSVPFELLLLLAMALSFALTGRAMERRTREKSMGALVAWAGVLLGLVGARIVVVILAYSSLQVNPNLAAVLGLSAASLAATAVARAKGLTSLMTPVWVLWSGAGAAYLVDVSAKSPAMEMVSLAVLGLAGLVHALALDGEVVERQAVRVVQLAVGWAIFSRLASLILAQPPFGIAMLPGVTVAWTVYAAILLGVGFGRRVDELRRFGLAVLGCTAVKLIWFDLANTSDFLRFAVTLGLGTAMIGGGYLYIRLRDRLGPSNLVQPSGEEQ